LTLRKCFKATEGDIVNGEKMFAHPKWKWLPNAHPCPVSPYPVLPYPENTNLELLSNADVKTRINFTSISFLSDHITFNSIFMILNKENKIKVLL
jgi:hypothetical protein